MSTYFRNFGTHYRDNHVTKTITTRHDKRYANDI